MSLYEWLLFGHVLAAFLLVAGVMALCTLVFAGGGEPVRRVLTAPAVALWNVGGLGVLVLGVWLAFEVDAYELWDAWILVAIVLWVVASGQAGQLLRELRTRPAADPDRGHRRRVLIMAVATAVLLVDMIFKPGA